MSRLLVSVLVNQNSGKTHTWKMLFGRNVRTGTTSRELEIAPGQCVTVFLVSGSAEERRTTIERIMGFRFAAPTVTLNRKMPRVISRHFSVTMQQLLPAVVTPVMTPMSMVRTRSRADVDPRYDDHSVARLRRSGT